MESVGLGMTDREMKVSDLIQKIKDYPNKPMRNMGNNITFKFHDEGFVGLGIHYPQTGRILFPTEFINATRWCLDWPVWVEGYSSYVESSLEYWGSIENDHIEITLGL